MKKDKNSLWYKTGKQGFGQDEDAFRAPVQSAVSSVMPDPTPDETPEEEDFEPIPAPKKTLIKKKPIVRAK